MKSILYVAIDDSSDIRVRKEVKTLQQKSRVFFLGLSPDKKGPKACSDNSFVLNKSYKNPFWLIYFLFVYIYFLVRRNYSSIHIVDEQLFLLLWPVNLFIKLIGSSVICLDVFDSLFLKNHFIPSLIPPFFASIFFYPCDSIIVTDSRRKRLYPQSLQSRIFILPNKPNMHDYTSSRSQIVFGEQITIAYIGTLSKDRGSSFLNDILLDDPRFSVISAGLIVDSYTHSLISAFQPRWSHHGNLSSQDLMRLLSLKADFILLYYMPTSYNNIFASPNKLWDAISLSIPVICNDMTLASADVLINNFGLVVDKDSLGSLYQLAFNSYCSSTKFSGNLSALSISCWWESHASVLLSAHRIT